MNWFCKPHRVCAQCRVHFEPDGELRHPELCPEHRRPVLELELRKELVARWAARNWEKLEPQAKEDEAKMQSAQWIIGNNQFFAQTANAQNAVGGAALGSILGSPLGGLGK